jgi:gliding motility-associated transport system permease protein/gliding motility-associatede transport system auxiliary component
MNPAPKLSFVRALAKRDLRRYFSNPTGYVFITLFIFLSAAAAFWRPRFFLNNLATLDQINEVFPFLLMFFVPALTMGIWADERRQGTDELLLTLPATNVEIVAGKYLAALGIYTASLVLSLSHVAILFWLGRPDPGLLAANYLGYWLAGAALIAVGMLGSLLTANTTVAFVLAALLCGFPVLIDAAVGAFSGPIARRIAPIGLFHHFRDFAQGVVSLSGVLYFVLLGGFFLYLNVLLLGQRYWPRRAGRMPTAAHHLLRAASVALAAGAIVLLASRGAVRIDATAERLHSLSDETKRLLDALPADRTVVVQAFVSPVVPAEYVQQRESLLSTLTELQALAGSKMSLVVRETEPYSEAARIARERFGIAPRFVTDATDPTGEIRSVFLGVAFTSGPEEQVLPFLEHGLSAEYELTRAIRVVARTSRKRIGIVDTEAKVFGGVDYEDGRARLSWAIVDELRKQYEVVEITPSATFQEKVDALLVVMPSTLLQSELDHVWDAVKRGVPALLVVDPLPAMDMRLAPAAGMAERLNPYRNPRQALVQKNYGDLQKALLSVGVNWPAARIAWDSYRPHAEMSHLPREVVVVGAGSGNPDAFNGRHAATSGLQELLLMYPGYLLKAAEAPAELTFEPLVASSMLAGTASYFQLVQPTPNGPSLNLNLPHEPENEILTLAAHVRSAPGAKTPVNLIIVADLDFISDQFFVMRQEAPAGATFDNVTFFLNAIDVLAGDEAFIGLRKRRVKYRTLERVEAQTRTFIERRSREEQQAAQDAEKALETARSGLQKTVDEIAARPDLDAQAKQIMIRNVQETENRKLEVLSVNIQQARDGRIQASRETMETGVRRIQGTIRTFAVLVPPLPVFVLGIAIYVRRRKREREGALAMRRLREIGE